MTLVLMKETEMAHELRQYAKGHGYTEEQTEDLIKSAYDAVVECHGDNWLVSLALQDGIHKHYDLIGSFDWSETEQGDDYWRAIYRYVDRLPEEEID